MARKILVPLDLTKQEIRNVLLQNVAGDASTPAEGQIWWDTSTQRVGVRGTSATHKLVRDGGDLSSGSVANTALTTNPLARGNHTGSQAASTISDLATTVQGYRLDQFAQPTAAVSFNSQRITGVATPTVSTDAANKAYVDNAIAGLSWKEAVHAATTANITLSGVQTIDAHTLVAGDRVLVKNQTTASENGIWVVAAGAWSRATDADTDTEIWGAAVFVQEGGQANTQWILTTPLPITIGTTGLTWTQFGGGGGGTYVAGNGLTDSPANTFNVGAGTGITVAADSVSIDTSVVARKFSASVGNNSLTSIPVTHSLGTRDVVVNVYDATSFDTVECDVVRTDTNNVTVTFAVAPTTNQYRVVVVG